MWELFRVSLALGAVGFGGGISVLAAIQALTVERRRWLTADEFANTATVAQILPGGAAANALASIGLRFQGFRGALIAYLGFVAPGALSILVLAWAYVRFGAVPHADAFLSGLNAAVVGVIIAITLRMLRTSVARVWQMAVAAGALLLSLVGGAGSGEVAFLGIGAGLVWDLGIERARLISFPGRPSRPHPPVALPEEGVPLPRTALDEPEAKRAHLLLLLAGIGPQLTQFASDLLPLAVVFFRTGLGAYGGGFAIIPSLHAAMLERGWLTEHQFADAVAVGKLTPGPVLLMATFIGYLRDGVPGALVATLAILAAPFFLVVFLSTWLDRARSSRWIRAALRGLTPSVVGLMAAAALTLGKSLHTAAGVGIAAAVALTLVRFERTNPVIMLGLGGMTRLALRYLAGV